MYIRKTLFLFLVMVSVASAQNYHIDWYVIGSGGGHSASGSYQLDGTIGQPIVGKSSSASYTLDAGFWVGATSQQGPACNYVVGDVNNSGGFNGVDVVFAVSYFKGGAAPPYHCVCGANDWYVAGDVNASCNFNGVDVTYAVGYFKGGPAPHPCADCPPGGLIAPPAPGEAPTPTIQPITNPTLEIKPNTAAVD
jgi:hypothetical protein